MNTTFQQADDNIVIETVPACQLVPGDIIVRNGDTLEITSEPRPFMGYLRFMYANLSNDRAWGFVESRPLFHFTRVRGLVRA